MIGETKLVILPDLGMASYLPATFTTACTLLLVFSFASCKAQHHLTQHTVDSFKSLANFPYAVALYDADEDGDLDCLMAVRTEFSLAPPSATYVVFQKDLKAHTVVNATHYLQPGPTPDSNVVILNNDYQHPLRNHFLFTDYENCIILESPMGGRQECALWVNSALKDIPDICFDQFQDNCDNGVKAYDQDSCGELIQ
uniref:Putative lipocalin-5 1 n=1 Tax=Amblyomma triste TaxID=251400 RepID=A0A023G5E8_AMBTT